MRTLLLLCLACCGGGQTFEPATLPDLVPTTRVAIAPVIATHDLLLVPGEHFVFEVQIHGVTIGRVELEVGDTEVTSSFATTALATMFATVHHDLSTVLDRHHGRAAAGNETLVIGSDISHFDLNGARGQTLHSALGVVRAWVTANAAPGVLAVQALGNTYQLALKRPLVEELQGAQTFHVTATINTEEPTTIQMWFATTPDRSPLRFTIEREDVHVTASRLAS